MSLMTLASSGLCADSVIRERQIWKTAREIATSLKRRRMTGAVWKRKGWRLLLQRSRMKVGPALTLHTLKISHRRPQKDRQIGSLVYKGHCA